MSSVVERQAIRNISNNVKLAVTFEEKQVLHNKCIAYMKKFGHLSIEQFAEIEKVDYMISRAVLTWTARERFSVPYQKDINSERLFLFNTYKGYEYDVKMDSALNLVLTILKSNDCMQQFKDVIVPRNNEPYVLFFKMGKEFYNIIYMAEGNEEYLEKKLELDNIKDSNEHFLVIMEDVSAINNLHEEYYDAFYEMNGGGDVSYVG